MKWTVSIKSSKLTVKVFANDATHERKTLDLKKYISDIGLPPWKDRIHNNYHIIANNMKQCDLPILNFCSCDKRRHNYFNPFIYKKLDSETVKAKALHLHHCSLYDVYELYLFYKSTVV